MTKDSPRVSAAAEKNEPIRLGVIGLGRMGTFHLSKFAGHSQCSVVGVFDLDSKRSEETSFRSGIRSYLDLGELFFDCDAVVIASPTLSHASIARQALDAGLHVLLEKPMTHTVREAEELVQLAAERQLIFQVGYLERQRVHGMLSALHYSPSPIRWISSVRHSTTLPREAGIDVCSDLMVHDLDIVLSLAGEDPLEVTARGIRTISDSTDIAVADLRFSSGVHATLQTSRVASVQRREIQVLSDEHWIELDLLNNKARSSVANGRIGSAVASADLPGFDALSCQADAFLAQIRGRSSSGVSGAEGLRVQRCLERILNALDSHLGVPRAVPVPADAQS